MSRTLNVRRDGGWLERGNWTGLLPSAGAPGVVQNAVASAPAGSFDQLSVTFDLPESFGGSPLVGLRWSRNDPTGTLGGPWTSPLTPVGDKPFVFRYLTAGTYALTVRAANLDSAGAERLGPAVTVTGTVVGAPAAPPTTPGASPLMSKTFVESCGVCMHASGGPWSNHGAIKSLITNSGIKLIRRSWPVGDTALRAEAQALRRDQGVQFIYWMGNVNSNFDAQFTPAQIRDEIKATNAGQPGTIVAVEGWNEPDGWNGQYGGNYAAMPWPKCRAYVQATWNTLKADPATAGIRIYGPSIANVGSPAPRQQLGNISAWVDADNQHPYTGGTVMTDGYIDSQISFSSNQIGSFTSGEIMTSESGISNKVPARIPQIAVPEDARAAMLPSIWLAEYRRGVYPNAIFSFFGEGTSTNENEGGPWHAGIGLADQFSFQPTASLNVLGNLVTLLADPGSDFTPAQFAYSVTGGDSKTRSLPLYKRDGTLWLVVWQEDVRWERYSGQYKNPAQPTVTINGFPSARSRISRYVISDRNETGVATSAASYSLPSQCMPTIVRIAP